MVAPDASVSVMIPTPTFDITTYKPFGDEFDRTIDRILSEEASMDDPKEEDWPIYPGSEGHSSSPSLFSSRSESLAQQSYHFTQSSTTNAKQRRARDRPAAKRNITVVDLDESGEEPNLAHTAGTMQVCSTDRPSDHKENRKRASRTKLPTKKKAREPLNDNGHGNNQEDSDVDEEEIMFSSLKPSDRDHLIQYIGFHPLLQSAQPMERSARRNFEADIRGKASSVGMTKLWISRLVRYVRRIHFDTKDDPPQPAPSVVAEKHIQDEEPEPTIHKRSLKRGRHSPEQTTAKKARTHSTSTSSPIYRDTMVQTRREEPSPIIITDCEVSVQQTTQLECDKRSNVEDVGGLRMSDSGKMCQDKDTLPVTESNNPQTPNPGFADEGLPAQPNPETIDDQPSVMKSKRAEKQRNKRRKKKQEKRRASRTHHAMYVPESIEDMPTQQSSKTIPHHGLESFEQSTTANQSKSKRKRERRKAKRQSNTSGDTGKDTREDVAKPAEMSPSRPKTPERKFGPAFYDEAQISPLPVQDPLGSRRSPFAALSPDPAHWQMDF